MTKALVLLSGGLDSMLAARLLAEQGIEVTGLSFKSYFFGTAKAKKAAAQLGIELIEVDFSQEHLAMVKNPRYGYGKNMNPCIDCHALMLRKAREILTSPNSSFVRRGTNAKGGERFDFVATGEVLGERPMSQNPEALRLVEKVSGLKGRLIRPLSAKLLDESDLEKSGKVIRGKLLDISGRSRKRQLSLVKKYGIKEYSSPGGGCLLTDPAFSEKLIKMLEYWPECAGNDIELLKHGRVYWLSMTSSQPLPAPTGSPFEGEGAGKKVLLVIGRDEKDNDNLGKTAQAGDALMDLAEEPGPTSLIRIKNYELRITNEIREIEAPEELKMSELELGETKSQEEIFNLALMLTGYYATKSRGRKLKLNFRIIN